MVRGDIPGKILQHIAQHKNKTLAQLKDRSHGQYTHTYIHTQTKHIVIIITILVNCAQFRSKCKVQNSSSSNGITNSSLRGTGHSDNAHVERSDAVNTAQCTARKRSDVRHKLSSGISTLSYRCNKFLLGFNHKRLSVDTDKSYNLI